MKTSNKYVFDLEKIIAFVNHQNKAMTNEKEILDTYDISDDGDRVNTKTVRELIVQGDSQGDNIRYDLIKTFIIEILTSSEDTYGVQVAIDTLINEGLMVEKKN